MAKRFYAVKIGRIPGLYRTWEECKAQVDGFPRAVFKGFAIEDEARAFISGCCQTNTSKVKNERPTIPSFLLVPVQKQKDYDEGRVIIYTDGSCLKNPGGPGGYAAVIQVGGSVKELAGAESSTTNNRMEMKAAIEALRLFDKSTDIVLHTDSQYLRKGFAQGWVEKWKRTGWITKAGTPVLNKELWQELDRLNSIHK